MNVSRRRIFAALGGGWLALAYGAGGASAVGQTDEPPIEDEPAEVVLTDEPTPERDRDGAGFIAPAALTLIVFADGTWSRMAHDDAVDDALDKLVSGNPVDVVRAALDALGVEA